MTRLGVWRETRRVGTLDTMPNHDVRFTYDPEVATDRRPDDAVGLQCPVRAQPYVGRDALAIFENLLPEGALRDTLGQATKHDASDTVGILGVVGGECAGALQLWPDGMEPPRHAAYDELSEPNLRAAFSVADGQLRQVTGRASLSGAQAKLALLRLPPVGGEAPRYSLPRNGSPTTVVVKRPSEQFRGLLEAELVGMRLMRATGVPTASSVRCRVAPTCHESARFDRAVLDSGAVVRHHAEDGCQLTGRTSRQKYASQGAPTYQELVAVLDRWSVDPLTDREFLFQWAVANAALGNYDAHAKNVGVVYVSADRVRLAPAYDVVVTAIFDGLDQNLALNFGGTNVPRGLTKGSLAKATREFRLTLPRATELADQVVSRIRESLVSVLHEVARDDGAPDMLDRLDASVRSTTHQVASRLQLST